MSGPDSFDVSDASVFDDSGIVDDPAGVAAFGIACAIIGFGYDQVLSRTPAGTVTKGVIEGYRVTTNTLLEYGVIESSVGAPPSGQGLVEIGAVATAQMALSEESPY
jgi:hypothetical protein